MSSPPPGIIGTGPGMGIGSLPLREGADVVELLKQPAQNKASHQQRRIARLRS
jgi:hypothetical protein